MNGLATRTPASDLERVDTWTGLADAALRRRATTAANSRDADELWGLLEAYQTAERGGLASSHTRRSYRTGLRVLLEAWEGENLLRPSPRAGENYRLALGRRLGPASVNLRLAAARALYRALRWSRATEADPFRDLSQVHDPVAPEDKCQPYSFWDPAAGEGETLRRSERDQAELEQLLDAAGHPADLVVILLGAHAGLRRSEMEALSALRGERGEPEARLLRPPLDGLAGQPAVYRALSATRLEARGLHALRHTAGSRLYQQSGDLKLVRDHLRHSHIETTRIYAAGSTGATRAAVQGW